MISKLHRRGRNMGVGDVAVFRHPQFADQWAVKRIAGMPGDYVCEDLPFEDTAASTGRMIQVGFNVFLLANLSGSKTDQE